jgi:hypothetical protein
MHATRRVAQPIHEVDSAATRRSLSASGSMGYRIVLDGGGTRE